MNSSTVTDYALYAAPLARTLPEDQALSPVFVSTREIAPIDHLNMQAAIQRFVDQASGKTSNSSSKASKVDRPFLEFIHKPG